jgi:hypothetical protein
MAEDSGDDEPYRVGYGKPPKHTRFRPGQSGNPRGRRKGARGLKTDLAAALGERQTIQVNRQPVTASRQRLLLMTLAARGAAGDVKAAAILLPLIERVLGIEDRGQSRQRLSAGDQAILTEMLGRIGAADLATGEPDPSGEGNDDGADRA